MVLTSTFKVDEPGAWEGRNSLKVRMNWPTKNAEGTIAPRDWGQIPSVLPLTGEATRAETNTTASILLSFESVSWRLIYRVAPPR